MIKITKNKEPKEWIEYRTTPGVDFQAIPSLVQSLLDEQGYICAYCMRRIPCRDNLYKQDDEVFVKTKEDHRIEHIKSRELHDDLKLNYNNMVICCPGHIGTEDHCDRLKKSRDITFSPMDQLCIDTIKYRINGEILSTDKVYNKELKDILNLNTKLLVKNRYATLTTIISKINATCKKGKNWDKKILTSYLKKYSEKHQKGDKFEYYPYCGIIIWFLNKKLKTLL